MKIWRRNQRKYGGCQCWRERNENEISAAWRQNLKWQWRRHVSGSEISASWLKASLSAAGVINRSESN
jgi:hypothetical protein